VVAYVRVCVCVCAYVFVRECVREKNQKSTANFLVWGGYD